MGVVVCIMHMEVEVGTNLTKFREIEESKIVKGHCRLDVVFEVWMDFVLFICSPCLFTFSVFWFSLPFSIAF